MKSGICPRFCWSTRFVNISDTLAETHILCYNSFLYLTHECVARMYKYLCRKLIYNFILLTPSIVENRRLGVSSWHSLRILPIPRVSRIRNRHNGLTIFSEGETPNVLRILASSILNVTSKLLAQYDKKMVLI